MKKCKVCGNTINSNNKHRNHCYVCKKKYPYQANIPNIKQQTTSFQLPWNRKEKYHEDVNKKGGFLEKVKQKI